VVREWEFAGDYVQAMYAMLQQETPEDFIIATGELTRCASLWPVLLSLLA